MKRLKSIFLYAIVFLGLLLFFMPKIYLYYAVEEQLDSKNIRISNEKVYDRGFNLAVEEGSLYYDDLVVGKFERLSLLPVILFNRVNVDNFTFSDDMSRFAKGTVQNVNVTHHIITPLTLYVSLKADAGDIIGEVNIKDRNISLQLTPSPALLKESPFWLKKLKKSDDGGYLYETTY